jgi:hypothetical protein
MSQDIRFDLYEITNNGWQPTHGHKTLRGQCILRVQLPLARFVTEDKFAAIYSNTFYALTVLYKQ